MRIPKLLRLITISIFLSRRARAIPAAANATIHFDMRKIRFRTESLCDEKPTGRMHYVLKRITFRNYYELAYARVSTEHSSHYAHTFRPTMYIAQCICM